MRAPLMCSLAYHTCGIAHGGAEGRGLNPRPITIHPSLSPGSRPHREPSLAHQHMRIPRYYNSVYRRPPSLSSLATPPLRSFICLSSGRTAQSADRRRGPSSRTPFFSRSLPPYWPRRLLRLRKFSRRSVDVGSRTCIAYTRVYARRRRFALSDHRRPRFSLVASYTTRASDPSVSRRVSPCPGAHSPPPRAGGEVSILSRREPRLDNSSCTRRRVHAICNARIYASLYPDATLRSETRRIKGLLLCVAG